MPRATSLAFLGIIAGLPLAQAGLELARGEGVQALEVVGPLSAPRLRAFEQELREASLVHRQVTPWYQWALLHLLGRGNEKAFVGKDGWLYYSEDLDYLTGADSVVGAGDPARAVAHFRDQLAAFGVELLVVPVPPKSGADPRHHARRRALEEPIAHPQERAFLAALRAQGVRFLDLGALYAELRAASARPLYLPRDTHWRPETMRAVAVAIAREARSTLGLEALETAPTSIGIRVHGEGDIVRMLRLPPGRVPWPPMDLAVFLPASESAQAADAASPVLLLGDSFTRVFSDPALGLGARAGLAETLAMELGLAVDTIAISGGGARAVREALARRAGRPAAEGGLAGKRLVVWQLSLRDLAAGPAAWAPVELGEPAALGAAEPQRLEVLAEVVEKSVVPAEFDYELCLAVYEYRVLEALAGAAPEGPLWVAHVAVADFEPTEAADLEPGDRLRLVLEDVERHHPLESTSWVDDTGSDVRATIWFPLEVEER